MYIIVPRACNQGAVLIGALLTAIGFGITTMQTYMWYRTFPSDSKVIRYVVWSISCLDIVHMIFTMHIIYFYVITNYNNPAALTRSVWSFDATIVVTAVITCITHGFYARRVYILSNRSWFLPTLIGILSAVRMILGCVVTVRMLQIKILAELRGRIGVLVGTGMGAGSLADWIITGSLVVLLRRKRSGFNRSTDNLIDRLTYWTINNGLLTSLLGLAIIISLVAMPYNMIYLALHLLLGKLYANSLLATLNCRTPHAGRGINESGEDGTTVSLPTRAPSGTSSFPASRIDRKGVTPVVHVETTIVSDKAD